MELKEIGIIHSPYDRNGMRKPPKQGREKNEISEIEVFKEYEKALMGLKVGDEILVIYWADKAKRDVLISRCRGIGEEKGVFALRSPHRPNPLLTTKVIIDQIDGNILKVRGLEAFDKSMLIDIKISID